MNYKILLLFLFSKTWAQSLPILNETRFQKHVVNPVLKADSSFLFYCPIKQDSVKWQKADVFNPAAIVKDGKIILLYRAEDNPKAHLGGRTSRIGLAESLDGVHFVKHKNPVLFPDHDLYAKYDQPGGCEDPRVVQIKKDFYMMTYTAWNHHTPRLSVAFSKDLILWQKKGPAFCMAYRGKYKNMASKSASVITTYKNGQYVAAKINGKYWMYWGELGVNLAWSKNLYDWFPSQTPSGQLAYVIDPRKGKFDSHLTECGPPAVITSKGVELIYNGRNTEIDGENDPKLAKGTYTVGKVVLDLKDLKTVKYRSQTPFLIPSLPHELTGQYKQGTCFAEGLVYFKKRWFLYYGTADSFVGLAISE
jgi:beta-1,2-mannosidase